MNTIPRELHSPLAAVLRALDTPGQLGAYDRRILEWLAGYEPSICAVVASLIARAAEPR